MIKTSAYVESITTNPNGTKTIRLTQFKGILKLQNFEAGNQSPDFTTSLFPLNVGDSIPVRHVQSREVVIDIVRFMTGDPAPERGSDVPQSAFHT